MMGLGLAQQVAQLTGSRSGDQARPAPGPTGLNDHLAASVPQRPGTSEPPRPETADPA